MTMTSTSRQIRTGYLTAMDETVRASDSHLDLLGLVTPHLTDSDRRSLIARVEAGEEVYIGTPALEVSDSYFIVVLRPVYFSVVKSKRCPVFDPCREAEFAREALDYAKKNWGQELKPALSGVFSRHEVPDEVLTANGLPLRRRDVTTAHFVSGAGPDSNIIRIFDHEIECLEHRGNHELDCLETANIVPAVFNHLRQQAQVAA